MVRRRRSAIHCPRSAHRDPAKRSTVGVSLGRYPPPTWKLKSRPNQRPHFAKRSAHRDPRTAPRGRRSHARRRFAVEVSFLTSNMARAPRSDGRAACQKLPRHAIYRIGSPQQLRLTATPAGSPAQIPTRSLGKKNKARKGAGFTQTTRF